MNWKFLVHFGAVLVLAGCAIQPYKANVEEKPRKMRGVIAKERVRAEPFYPALKNVQPALRDKVIGVYAMLRANGFDVRPVEGYRSKARQAELLASGMGVTQATPGRSCHNYGLAVDSAVFVNGEPTWDIDDPHVAEGYALYGRMAEAVGLRWGGRWTEPRDYPHVELRSDCLLSMRNQRVKPVPLNHADTLLALGHFSVPFAVRSKTMMSTLPTPEFAPLAVCTA